MLERFKFLLEKLREAEAAANGEHKALYGDRARTVGNWIKDIERGWSVDTDYACTCATEFERMVGIA
jgi:hypothetical protein